MLLTSTTATPTYYILVSAFSFVSQTMTLIKTVSSPVSYVSFAVQCEEDRRQWLATLFEPALSFY